MKEQKYNHIANDGEAVTILRTTPYVGKAIISRFKGSYSDYAVQNRRQINLLLESNLAVGEVIQTASQSFLTLVSKPEVVQGEEISIIAHGILCNSTLTVTRDQPQYDEDGNLIGQTPVAVIEALPCHAIQINGKMRETDAGLLPTTVMKTYLTSADGLINGDKAQVFGNDYRVDDINFAEYPGVMVLQLSAWAG